MQLCLLNVQMKLNYDFFPLLSPLSPSHSLVIWTFNMMMVTYFSQFFPLSLFADRQWRLSPFNENCFNDLNLMTFVMLLKLLLLLLLSKVLDVPLSFVLVEKRHNKLFMFYKLQFQRQGHMLKYILFHL